MSVRSEPIERIGQPNHSPGPNKGIYAPNVSQMPTRTGLIHRLGQLAKVRVNRHKAFNGETNTSTPVDKEARPKWRTQ